MSVTTGSDAAFDAYVAAMDLALAHQDGALDLLGGAVAVDDGFALAWALLGLQQRAAGDIPGGTASINRACTFAPGLSEREQSHLHVLDRFVALDVPGTEAAILAHLERWPRDAIIVMQSHYLYNLFDPRADRDRRMLDLDERIAPAYGEDWFMRAELAFAAEENGDYARARDLAEQSLDQHPMNAVAAHSLAHVYLETGDIDAGSAWLHGWLTAWEHPSPYACHLTWHLALLRLAADDAPDTVRLLQRVVSYAGLSVGALSDGASLAWRLHVDGVDTELPWPQLVALPDRPGFTFANAHHALALAGLGDHQTLLAYSDALEGLATAGHPTAGACAAFARGLAALTTGSTHEAADHLVALLPQFRSFGGSRAQTEVFEDAAITAVEHAGNRTLAAELLHTRLRRRPSARDDRWLARLG